MLYKYEYLGQVEKEGQIFKKYKKVRRIPFLKQALRVLFYVTLFALVLFLLTYLGSVMSSGKLK